MKKPHHTIGDLKIVEKKLELKIDGNFYSFDLSKISDKLSKASVSELNHYEISPSGYGIHWSLLDEDISIDGLLRIKHQIPRFPEKHSVKES
jgi:hypothetical protein